MFKYLSTILIVFFFVSITSAQDAYHKFEVSGGYSFERTKGFPGDVYTGTSTSGTSTTGSDRTHNLNGFNTSAVYNFSRYFGAKVDFSGHYGSDTGHTIPGGVYRSSNGFTILVIPSITTINASQHDYRFMGGVQFKDNSKDKKVKPFANFLLGSARQKTEFTNLSQQFSNINGGSTVKSNAFSMALGGGLDVKLSKRIDIRVLEFDYNPVFNKEKLLVANGSQIDSLVTSFTGGSTVTTLQDVRIPKHTQHDFRIGFGIVFH